MVVVARLNYIKRQVEQGTPVSMHIFGSQNCDQFKVRVNLGANVGASSETHLPLIFQVFDLIENSMNQTVVVDRGHKFSTGRSEVSFFIKPFVSQELGSSPPGSDGDQGQEEGQHRSQPDVRELASNAGAISTSSNVPAVVAHGTSFGNEPS